MYRGSLRRIAKDWLAAAMFISIAALVFGISTDAQAQSDMRVKVDEARIVPLVKTPSTVIVGNPAIADVSIQNGNLLVLMGRNYGSTNVIALDSTGEEIANMEVSVTTSGRHELSLHKGSQRTSYNCAPMCERELNIGDGVVEFEQIAKQITAKTSISDPSSEASEENE